MEHNHPLKLFLKTHFNFALLRCMHTYPLHPTVCLPIIVFSYSTHTSCIRALPMPIFVGIGKRDECIMNYPAPAPIEMFASI